MYFVTYENMNTQIDLRIRIFYPVVANRSIPSQSFFLPALAVAGRSAPIFQKDYEGAMLS